MPTLQQFFLKGLHLVGIDRKEAPQVVRNLWRKTCMCSAQQVTGGANRCVSARQAKVFKAHAAAQGVKT